MSEGVAGNEKEEIKERRREAGGRERGSLVSRASLGPRGRCRTEGRETREKDRKMRKSGRNRDGTWICHFF